ncbi:MAG TPA: TetR family transcriptional regulator [Novosphingobium sp.]|nr:TetR family transcriptional regulator [Novosphingobium sp.]
MPDQMPQDDTPRSDPAPARRRAGSARQPKQPRSQASLERMLQATQALMLERGNEDFTLQDVGNLGQVSIGSIYLRFAGKDNLVRAVIAQEFERIEHDEREMLIRAIGESACLADFIPRYVTAYAEMLRQHAPLLRLIMERAQHDPLVSEPGKRIARSSDEASTQAMLRYRHEFGGQDHELKANAAYQIIFSTLARYLSLGSVAETREEADWASLKIELGRMTLAYLSTDP